MYAHGGGEGSISKDFQKLGHKNAIKHKNRRTPPGFLTTPCTPSKEFENECMTL
jgi:hypothetical protein